MIFYFFLVELSFPYILVIMFTSKKIPSSTLHKLARMYTSGKTVLL